MADPNLLTGIADDAGVYRLKDDLALIQTVDFFTPIVNDPFIFGQVAVANALSDVYAMGGRPLLAMNIICFPINQMDIMVLQHILLGGVEKLREAEVLLVGGHSVEDDEVKYGLAVTGVVHPQRVWTRRGAKAGDKLLLTKPLGTGIVNTAVKGEMASEELEAKAIKVMTALNRKPAEILTDAEVHACADVTGFGLLGHLCEMAEESRVGMTLYSAAVPFFPEVKELVQMGLVPGGLHRNRQFRMPMLDVAPEVSDWLIDVFFDPQTSGGLLFSLPPRQAEDFLQRLHREGVGEAAIIGEVTEEPEGRIRIV